MNRKIALSLGVLVFVVAVTISATGAFFSDSETSTGNTFTAGAIDLTVDSEQHYNNMVCDEVLGEEGPEFQWVPEANFVPGPNHYPVPGSPCNGTWIATNLGPQHQFFNFSDVKPGDEGENTISLHIDNNPAWACADLTITENDDESTVDPETDAGDAVEDPGNLFDGELAQNLWFVAWPDIASTSGGVVGDNIWQGQALEPLYFQPGPAFNVINGTTTLALADASTGGNPLPGGATSYVGLAWCAGTMTVVGNTLECDGSTMGNVAQTDKIVGNLLFRVEQHRNNENFLCSPRGEEEPATGSITVDKEVSFSDQSLSGVQVGDFSMTLSGPGGPYVITDETAITGLQAGVYTVSEVYVGSQQGVLFNATFSGDCVDNGDTGTITLSAGENASCSLLNSLSL